MTFIQTACGLVQIPEGNSKATQAAIQQAKDLNQGPGSLNR